MCSTKNVKCINNLIDKFFYNLHCLISYSFYVKIRSRPAAFFAALFVVMTIWSLMCYMNHLWKVSQNSSTPKASLVDIASKMKPQMKLQIFRTTRGAWFLEYFIVKNFTWTYSQLLANHFGMYIKWVFVLTKLIDNTKIIIYKYIF